MISKQMSIIYHKYTSQWRIQDSQEGMPTLKVTAQAYYFPPNQKTA